MSEDRLASYDDDARALLEGERQRPGLPELTDRQIWNRIEQAVTAPPPPRPPSLRRLSSQVLPWGVAALNGAVEEAAWRSKPSWYLVATDDHMIPPNAQRSMARRAGAEVVENKGSHSVYVSQAQAVVRLIKQAAEVFEKALSLGFEDHEREFLQHINRLKRKQHKHDRQKKVAEEAKRSHKKNEYLDDDDDNDDDDDD